MSTGLLTATLLTLDRVNIRWYLRSPHLCNNSSVQNILATYTDKMIAATSPCMRKPPVFERYSIEISYATLCRRRKLFSRLCHEAIVTHQHGKGISFTDMWLLLARHKLIVDKEALV